MDSQFLINLLLGVVFFYFGVRAYVIFLRRHTKYNLVTLIVFIILFIDTILAFFFPDRWKFVGGIGVRRLIGSILMILLALFLFYPETKEFFNKRKKKTQ